MRFDVSVTNSNHMDIDKRSHDLISVKLDQNYRQKDFLFNILSVHGVDSLREVWHDYMKVGFIRILPSAKVSVGYFKNVLMI